jgi:hypothetical protein
MVTKSFLVALPAAITSFLSRKNYFSLRIAADDKEHAIDTDRKRTNLLRAIEQPVLVYLCRIMPMWLTSDMLTFIGLIGSAIVAAGFVMARTDKQYLLVSIMGFAIQWFGDSLDGRLAYFRNSPRKWYGFSLDICIDWISIILIGLGFYYFLPQNYKLLAFGFVTIYGWAMLLALLKYRVTDTYAVDTGLFGPTEFRVALCLVLIIELIIPGALTIAALVVIVLLSIICFANFYSLLQSGNARDKKENGQLYKN